MRARLPVSIGIGVVLVLVVAPSIDRTEPRLLACGPITSLPEFAPRRWPDDPRFFSGALGIVQPTYDREALVAAWRTLAGRPLVDAERRAYLPDASSANQPTPVDTWLAARGAAHAPQVPMIFQDTFLEPTYSYITNCGDSAFLNAASTLHARIEALGADSPEVAAWVTAQDVVFSNCSRRPRQEPAIPEPLAPTASSAAQADRAYQIAAAQLYAGRLTEAEAGFTAIAHDTASPWHRMGPYLAARAMIRQATMGGKDAAGDPAALPRARDALKAVIADPSQAEMHGAAERLLHYLDARADPAAALTQAAAVLSTPQSDAGVFAGRLNDFRILMDRFWDGRVPAGVPGLAPARESSELVDWLVTLDVWSPETETHAIARWDATRSPVWLVAALIKLDPGDARQSELLYAAAGVHASSPAYLTLAFNRARILLLTGDHTGARDVLTRALAAPNMPASSANVLKAARLLTARTLDEFLADSARTAIVASGTGAPTLDLDSVDALNEQVPLAMLRAIAAGHALPDASRANLLRSVFARAVLLQDAATVRGVIPSLVESTPELRAALARVGAATADPVLLDEARLVLLAHPGLRPFLSAGIERRSAYVAGGPWKMEPLTAIDNLRDNWWCSFEPKPNQVSYETEYWQRGYGRADSLLKSFRLKPNEPDRLAFLTDAERRQAADERTALQKLDSAPNELGRWATTWVEDHPTDPRASKVLYQVVRATRYGCTNERTGPISHRAFTLLHRRYPDSEWATKTPFWFN